MTTETIISSETLKKFLLTEIDDSTYNVQIITATYDEIENGNLNEFGAYPNEKYSVLTAGGSTYELKVNQMDPGQSIELGYGITLTRLA